MWVKAVYICNMYVCWFTDECLRFVNFGRISVYWGGNLSKLMVGKQISIYIQDVVFEGT